MQSFPDGFRALVLGSSGAIGAAALQQLQQHPRCGLAIGLHRRSQPALDFDQPQALEDAAKALAAQGPFHLILIATGSLHGQGLRPEKRLAELDAQRLARSFHINAIGPALLLRHFTPLLDRQRAVMAVLSARVGSIGDNRLGGWYGYRSAKAALNMLLKTAAIETARINPAAVLLALHPGTVDSALSAPFRGAEIGRSPTQAAADLLARMDAAPPTQSGSFLAWDGSSVPW
jgi:NAD(P)-dependent dehydrogenase (short-subunit alcohol dehydrogenase family)